MMMIDEIHTQHHHLLYGACPYFHHFFLINKIEREREKRRKKKGEDMSLRRCVRERHTHIHTATHTLCV
ncbi:hypothetical protein OAV88_03300 [bacterium]|nr:hypothetical protein [bacterium]